MGNVLLRIHILNIHANTTDIQVYDMDIGNIREYKPIVAFVPGCPSTDPSTQNSCPVIGMKATEESGLYKKLTYTYSGWGGINGVPGNEYIKVWSSLFVIFF